MQNMIKQITNEIKKVIIGKDEKISKILMSILAEGHVLLEDVPGVGKTTLANSLAKTLGLDSRRVQFTSDSVPSDIIGFSIYEKNSGNFVYKPGAVMTNVLLADEINRTSSKTQSALLEAMEEKNVTVDGNTYELPKPFVVLATQNPIGSAGTQMLPNSQLDRFLIRASMGYPDYDSQINIMRDRHTENPIDKIASAVTKQQLLDLIKAAASVHVSDVIYKYVSDLVQATRDHALTQLGISPRGAIAICRMAKSCAFVSGRDYVTPEDIVEIFPDVCGHRLVLNSKARLNERDAYDILKEIVGKVEMPTTKKV